MGWVYLDDGFPHHPKIVAVGADGLAMYVAGLCYAKRYNTGGRIPSHALPSLLAVRYWGRSRDKLLAARLWEPDGDGIRIHDYEDWNRSQTTRSEAGRKAARARWDHANRNANAYADRNATASESHMRQDAQSPPLPSYESQSSTYAGAVDSQTTTTTDEDDQSIGMNPDERVAQALDWLAYRDLIERRALTDRPAVRDPDAWIAQARARRELSDGDRLAHLARERPDADPAMLAVLTAPDTRPVVSTARNAIHDDQQAAAHARAQRGMSQLKENKQTPIDPNAAERIKAIRKQTRGG